MDYLRSSVNLRAYGQREPLIEYKREGLMMFREMQNNFLEQVANLIIKINTDNIQINLEEKEEVKKVDYITNEKDINSNINPSSKSEPEVGRNDPCPCGSGKKYKKCHGA
jgi:preprotein translocase subunit SecA